MIPFFNLGPAHFLVAWFVSSGIGIGIAVAPVGRIRPAIAAGFFGTLLVIWYEHAASARSLRLAVGPGLHVFTGLGVAAAAYLCIELLGRQAPAHRMRWSWLWFVCGASGGLTVGFVVGFSHGVAAGLASGLSLMTAGGLTGLVGEPIVTVLDQAADPVAVMRRDRFSFLASWLAVGTAVGLGTGVQNAYGFNAPGHSNGLVPSTLIGITNFIVPGIGFALIQATWGKYFVARCLLAASGRLPWRLTSFLQDAAVNRGVLRQFGAVYQFRHVELQRRLAVSTRSTSPGRAVEK
jgi:hypothetical protein